MDLNNIKNDDLEHAVINQLEADFGDQDFDAMSELLQILMKSENNREILFNYLGDTAQENVKEGLTNKRYS